jgi:lipoprotein-anchoring transpeptidase ErfK/SrfK
MPSTLALMIACSLAAATGAGAHTHTNAVGTSRQELALLLRTQVARAAPSRVAPALESVNALRPLTHERTALPVRGRARGPHGIEWLRVLLPGRPNAHMGWIEQRATRSASTRWRIVVDTGRRRVTVYRDGMVVRSFRAVVGKPSTPTPHGAFFVEEVIALPATEPGAPYALALSARSNVLQEFAGGPGQIALHGLENVGGVPGTAVSHGCVRLANDGMRWLVGRIAPGVPVLITG